VSAARLVNALPTAKCRAIGQYASVIVPPASIAIIIDSSSVISILLCWSRLPARGLARPSQPLSAWELAETTGQQGSSATL
jgi:hypothetical protein